MSVRMNAHPTNVCTITFAGPLAHAAAVREAVSALGFAEVHDTLPWREAFPVIPDGELPGRMLRAARTKEDMTQRELARLTGIPQRHVSEMEHGKRAIGKERAKVLSKALKIDYHVLL